MSTRRLNVEITGSSRGLEAALNRINAGLGRTQGQIRQTNKEMGLWQRQLMAIGTTARYALAGQFVFGVTAAITRLADFQTQLGRVASLAGDLNRQTGQYTGPSQGFLQGVGDQAILESNKVGIATTDIQAYMTRFFSTFQVPPGTRMKEMSAFVDEVARLGAMLGTEAGDPQQLAGGIAAMVNQIPGGRRNIGSTTNRVANMISFMLAETPNVTGRDIGRDIGRIGQSASIANMTPEQAFAVWGLAGKAGGSAGVLGRGVAQLLGSSLLHPQTKEQVKAYGQMGLPADPNMLARMGGFQVLLQMMERVGGNVKIRNPKALGNEELSDEDALAAAGITGLDRTTLYKALGRQESVRQFIALMGQGGVKALKDYIATQDKATKSNAVRSREEEFQKQNALTRFNQQRANLGLGLARGIQWPLENIVAPPVGALSNAVTEHRTATQVALGALFGAMAIGKGGSIFKAWRNRKAGGSPGQELVGGLLATEAASNVLAGGPTDGTRANPFWVIIHPTSWAVGQPGGGVGGPPGVPGDGPEKKLAKSLWDRIPGSIKAGVAGAAAAGWRGSISTGKYLGRRVGPKALIRGPGPIAALTALAFPEAAGADIERGYGNYDLDKLYPNTNWRKFGMLNMLTRQGTGDPAKTRMFNPILQQFANKEIAPAKAEAMLERMAAARGFNLQTSQSQRVDMFGHGVTDVTVRLVDAQGRPIKIVEKKGIPMKFALAKPAPTFKGKNRSTDKSNQNERP